MKVNSDTGATEYQCTAERDSSFDLIIIAVASLQALTTHAELTCFLKSKQQPDGSH
jgi:hypothetical protein